MYHKNLLKEALLELGVSYSEESSAYKFAKELPVTIATPQTYFSFKTSKFTVRTDEDTMHMDFDKDINFQTKAPFVTFTPSRGCLLVRLSHTKF